MSAGVVVSQPGQGEKGGEMVAMQQPGMQPGAGFAQMPQVVVPAGLPPGLAYLAGLDEVRIHQQVELLEGKSAFVRTHFLQTRQQLSKLCSQHSTDLGLSLGLVLF